MSERAGGRRLRVVVAEDEAIIRLDLVEMLAEENYEVVGEAGRGDEALAVIREQRPDLSILDVKMPGVDGLTVAAQIVEESLCAVVVLTAFSQRELIERASEAGVLAYLVKPFQKPELIAAIEIAHARFSDLRALTDEVTTLEERLAARKVIDRAKAVLQSQGLSERDAFARLQRDAMNQRTTMAAVAERVVSGIL